MEKQLIPINQSCLTTVEGRKKIREAWSYGYVMAVQRQEQEVAGTQGALKPGQQAGGQLRRIEPGGEGGNNWDNW